MGSSPTVLSVAAERQVFVTRHRAHEAGRATSGQRTVRFILLGTGRTHAGVHKPLDPAAVHAFSNEQVASRVEAQHVGCDETTGVVTALAKRPKDLQVRPPEDPDPVIRTVCDKEETLLRVT